MAKKSNSKDILRKLLALLATPYFLGLLLTFYSYFLVKEYYSEKSKAEVPWVLKSKTFQVLDWVNQKSLDFQFRLRGNRPVSDDIALVTVDEKAVQQEGRWPWPRGKIKQIIDNVMKYEPRVMGFDAIFSEEDINATVLALRALKENPQIPAAAHSVIDDQIVRANTDADLADAVKNHAAKLVMGIFFEGQHRVPLAFQNQCLTYLFKDTPSIKNWESVQDIVINLDKAMGLFEEDMPAPWQEILNKHRETLITNSKKKYYETLKLEPSATLNKTQTLELEVQNEDELYKYCQRWLTRDDEILATYKAEWPKIAAAMENPQLDFESGIEHMHMTNKINPVTSVSSFVFNYPGITKNLQHQGYFNAFQDPDGTIRRTGLVARIGNNYFPSLALKAFLVSMGLNVQVSLSPEDYDPERKYISNLYILKEGEPTGQIPVSKSADLLINFAGPQKMFPHVSVADILNDDTQLSYEQMELNPSTGKWELKVKRMAKADFFKDKILLFGATAIGIFDLRVTPFEENYPGLETHANIVDNLLTDSFYVEKIDITKIGPLFLGLGIFCTFLFGYLGAIWGFFIAIASSAGYVFYDKNFLFAKGHVFPVWFPILLLGGIYLTITVFKYFTEERNKKQLKSTFQKYVSPAIVNEILSDPGKLELGGRKQKMTVFFSDVRGFTTISEKLDPRALSDLLNSYLTPMTDLVFKNRGTLDKYMGDAVMAFFGAPVPYPDHAAWACRCALEQLQKLFQLQEEYRKQGLPEIDIGIGLNTGEMSVGNMGSETVRNYTVMGDAVNLGSRLEGINKQYGTRIIISEFTQGELNGKFVTRELDWVRVKGKLKPVKIFELIAEGKTSADFENALKCFGEGYEMYHKMQWAKAAEHFNKALTIKPDDGPSKLYLERCLDYQADPPPTDWDGVFVMKTK